MTYYARIVSIALCLAAFAVVTSAQAPAAKTRKPSTSTRAAREADALAEARRTMAVSLLTSLTDEAKSFRDLMVRARVQSRSADALWDTDPEMARALFRRAWESAETADDENARRSEEEWLAWAASRGSTARRQPPSMRREVLRLAARHDRELGEEFLRKLDDAGKQDAAKSPTPATEPAGTRINPDDPPPAMAQRLSLARQLLEDGDIERAMQFADPALYPVNTFGMNILDMLHEKNPGMADQRYLSLLARAANDPLADANTVSLLSAYVFTPYLYITARPDGQSHTRRWAEGNTPPADIPPAVRNAFFRAAASVLLGPVAEPDLSSSGRLGTFVVIARMLQLFERHGNDQAPALRARLAILANDAPERMRNMDDPLFTRGIVPEDPNRDRVQEALDRLQRAKTSDERDAVYFRAAMAASDKDPERARELADKIEDSDMRKQLITFLAFKAMREAMKEKKPDEVLRLARSQELTNVQRAWGLTEAAALLAKTEPERAAQVLDMAGAEARRIDQSSPDRVRTLVAIVTQLQKVESARAWGMMDEVIKAANSLSGFSGEDGEMTLRVALKTGGAMTTNFNVESFDLTGLFTSLAQEDFNRAVDLPKQLTGESPRAVAVLAIARTVLDKKKKAEPR